MIEADQLDFNKLHLADSDSNLTEMEEKLQTEAFGSVKVLGYHKLSEEEFKKALQGGPKSVEYTALVSYLTNELRVLCNIDECVNPIATADDSVAFVMEASSFLNELGCPYSSLTQGPVVDRLSSTLDRILVVQHLAGELMAARILRETRPEKKMELKLQESSQASDLRKILQTLGFPKPPANIIMKTLLERLIPTIQGTVNKASADLLGTPIFNGSLSEKQWEVAANVQQELHADYRIRREMLLKRLDCTIQSFQWSDRTRGKNEVFEKTYVEKRKLLKTEPEVDLSDLLASRDDLAIIEKTSSASVRKNTKSAINKVIIGQVPDRGGRPSEQAPPPPEMPPWQQRQGGPPSGGGFRGGRGGSNFSGGRGNQSNQGYSNQGGFGQSSYSNQGGFQSQGQRSYHSQGQGNYQSQKQGNYQSQGQGNYQSQGQGNYKSQGQGSYRPGQNQGQGYSKPFDSAGSYGKSGGSDYSSGSISFSLSGNDYSKASTDYSKGTTNFSLGGNAYAKSSTDYSRGGNDYSKSSTDYSHGGNDYSKSSTDYSRGGNDYSKSSTDYSRGGNDYSKSSTDYSRGGTDYSRGATATDYSRNSSFGGNSSYARGGNDYQRSGKSDYSLTSGGLSSDSFGTKSNYSQGARSSGGGFDSAGSYGGYQEPKRAKTYDQFQPSKTTYADQYVQESQHNQQYQSRDDNRNRSGRGGRSNYSRGGGGSSYR